jgi:uncharacterized membrane-anchored protein
MMALLAFPVAKEVGQLLGRAEAEVADLMQQLVDGHAQTHEKERELLARLTRLAAEVELSVSHTAYRFGAADAYDSLVRQRIGELREQRLPGFPTIDEFMARRLARPSTPAAPLLAARVSCPPAWHARAPCYGPEWTSSWNGRTSSCSPR